MWVRKGKTIGWERGGRPTLNAIPMETRPATVNAPSSRGDE